MPITEEHILECYEAYIRGDACPYPQGMNATSAEMTMTWLACVFNDQRCNRGLNAMQCRVLLARIQADCIRGSYHITAINLTFLLDHF
jgi:hypothetical protein